ncbi:Putative teichuronic acid biosynthesis glycosyltransferase TuaC [bacterium HR24]|jgi:glycosyltransferase involved in cell wall biosynthesis|nr:Putative teichuronic acid biosynthesis glycosyltransferase TuaC [bacterium HR24]
MDSGEAMNMRVLVVTNMYPQPDRPAFGVFVRDQVESLRRMGLEMDVFFIDGRRNRLNYLWAYPRLWRALARQRYDLVHAHYIFSGLVALGQRRYPVVLTHHGPEVFMTWESVLCRLFTRFFDEVIVVSEEMRERLRFPRARVIPCGVDLEMFRPLPQAEARFALGLPPGKRLVLWAGEHFRPEKRWDLVQAGMEVLRSRRDDVELVLASGRPHELVPLYMNACDVLLLVSDAEGSPMVVKEAMACNLPVVSTPVGDVPQIIAGTKGCFLCTQDPHDIAAKLEMALDFGRRTDGRERVRHLSLEQVAERVAEVYAVALARRGVRRGRPARAGA